jgi:hypothetical protein
VLDKTGRIQRFNRNGDFIELSASIDAYLGNGFVIKDDEAVLVCSGIVLDEVPLHILININIHFQEGKTVCDDWIETIKLDGSTWSASK